MVDIVAAAVAANVRDAPFVIVASRHAGIAVEASVVLTGLHELLEVGVLVGGGRGHAVVGVGGVGWERGRSVGGWYKQRLVRRMRRRVVVFSEVVHGWAYAGGSSFQRILFLLAFDLIPV